MARQPVLSLLLALWVFAPAVFAVDYPPVVPGRAISLAQDAGAHPDYRTEWWYVTGWLRDGQGQERGFQLTFFRVRTGLGEQAPGRFSPAQLILAHAAVSDPAIGHLLHAERSARASGRIAGASRAAMDVWIEDWRLDGSAVPMRAQVRAGRFAFDLALEQSAPPMLNGEAGFSQKGPQRDHASYYYSLPGLQVSGSLSIDGHEHRVTGSAWLDHEWSSELMPEGAVGWDWVGLNLDDGSAVMAARMRDADDRAMWAIGSLRRVGQPVQTLAAEYVAFKALRTWTSPRTGARYPVEWEIRVGERVLRLEPLMEDQERDSSSTGTVYWEGAVRVFEHGRPIGKGYLEMTGRAERMRI